MQIGSTLATMAGWAAEATVWCILAFGVAGTTVLIIQATIRAAYRRRALRQAGRFEILQATRRQPW